MSRTFNGSASNYLRAASASRNAYPVTLACWAYFDDNSTQKTIMHLGNGAGGGDGVLLQAAPSGGVVAVTWHSGGFAASGGHAHPAISGWHHVAGVFSANSRRCYLDGVADTADTTSTTKGTWAHTMLGIWEWFGGFYYPMNGDIAAAGIWSSALSAGNIALLASGRSPQTVDAGNLVDYWPCHSSTAGETSTTGGVNLTETGTVGADTGNHPTIFLPPLVCDAVSYTSSPQDVSMLASRQLVADAVSYSTSVQDISMLVSRLLTADPVTYSLALQDIETLVTRQMTLDAATYTHSPQDITMAVTRIMALDPVSYSYSAQDITMLVSRLLTMDEVTFTASPQDITMLASHTFTLDPVTFSMSAQDIIMLLSRLLTAEAVTFTFAPQDITMTLGNTYTLVADAVSYSLTVQDADLLASRVLTAEPAVYALNIQGVTIYAGVVYDSQGYFTVTIMDQVIDVVIQDAAIDVIIQDEIQDVIV